jgi:hypothetical protein
VRSIWLAALTILSLGACETQPQADQPPEPPTPLEIDPTERIELAQWWSNGAQLLRLDQAGSYSLYPDNNRYHEPLEVGRWRRGNYVTVWLDPYVTTGRPRPSSRGELRRVDGRLTLDIPASGPRGSIDQLIELQRPPTVVEDRMIGEWSGEGGTLLLAADGRYRYSAPFGAGENLGRVAGHDGHWTIESGQVIFQPDYGGAIVAELTMQNEAPLRLRMPSGELRPSAAIVGATVP